MEQKKRNFRSSLFWLLSLLLLAHCYGESDQEATWVTPIPNLNSAMEGFDPFSSNPFERPDPGSRGQIFEPFEELDDGRVVINSFIDKLREDIHCDTDFSGTTIRNYHQYRMKKTANYKFSTKAAAKVSAGGWFFNFKASFGFGVSGSGSERNTFNYFQAGVGEIVESTAECVTHTVSLSSFIKPTFTKAFIRSLRSLHMAAVGRLDKAESTDVFIEFVKDYGTHYMKKTSLGSKLIFEKQFSSFSNSYEQESERQNCIAASARGSLGGGVGRFFSAEMSFSASSKKCAGSSYGTSSGHGSRYQREKIVTIGTLPTANLEVWAESAKDSPVPVRFELETISFLFKDDWLSSIPVDPRKPKEGKLNASAIHDFFEEKTSHYCELMTGQNNCDFNDKGCGLNSECPYNTKCVNDKDAVLGYKCQRIYGKTCVWMIYTIN